MKIFLFFVSNLVKFWSIMIIMVGIETDNEKIPLMMIPQPHPYLSLSGDGGRNEDCFER